VKSIKNIVARARTLIVLVREAEGLKNKTLLFRYLTSRTRRESLSLASHKSIWIQLKRCQFWFGVGASELFSYVEIFVDDDYRMSELTDLTGSEIVLDIGANVGLFALAMTGVNPNTLIYSFEPNPDPYSRLLLNLEANHASKVTPVAWAVYSECGQKKFNTAGATTGGSLDDHGGSIVNCTTVDEFCAERGIRSVGVLKIDVEGAELEVLRGAQRVLAFTKYVVVECHSENLMTSVAAMLTRERFRKTSERRAEGGGGILRYKKPADGTTAWQRHYGGADFTRATAAYGNRSGRFDAIDAIPTVKANRMPPPDGLTIRLMRWALGVLVSARKHNAVFRHYSDYFVSRFRGHDVRVRIGLASGLLLSTGQSNSNYSLALGLPEPDTERAIEMFLQSGMTFYDIGANFGVLSMIAARFVGPNGHVVSFEPLEANVQILKHNAHVNSFDNIRVLPIAVGSSDGNAQFRVTSDLAHGSLSAPEQEVLERAGEISVPVRRLDVATREYQLPGPDVIKIDVEGGEIEVLPGAAETIDTYRPLIFLELHDTVAPIVEFLTKHNYAACLPGSSAPVETASKNAHLFAFPREREDCASLLRIVQDRAFPICERCGKGAE